MTAVTACGDCEVLQDEAREVPDSDLRDIATALHDLIPRFDNAASRNLAGLLIYIVAGELLDRQNSLRWAHVSMQADGHMLAGRPDDVTRNEIGETFYQQSCWCGWKGTLTTSEADAEVAGLDHLRDVGAPDIREGDQS